jgi:hypothetical protein
MQSAGSERVVTDIGSDRGIRIKDCGVLVEQEISKIAKKADGEFYYLHTRE